MATKPLKITLSFSELKALHHWLSTILQNSNQLIKQSIHYRIQIEILGEVLLKKLHPKTLIDTGKPIQIKLKTIESLAIQAALYNGWNYCYDDYVQNVIRHLSMNNLPPLTSLEPTYLSAPDVWEEE